jgi:two-component system, chemotaxis family, sensor kinase CheA
VTELDEIIREFLVESSENLEQLDRELLMLEQSPGDLNTVNVIFRIVHTVKGTCGFFEFKRLERVAHVGENLLDSIRAGEITVTPAAITALLEMSDRFRRILGDISATGAEGAGDDAALIERLALLNSPNATITEVPQPIAPVGVAAEKQPLDELDELFEATRLEWEKKQTASESEPAGPTSAAVAALVDRPREESKDGKKNEVVDTTLRVDITVLDKLMNLVGELVLARNQILQFTKSHADTEFVSTTQRLNLITSELQEGVMRTRMQPISTVWNKLPRIVRDIARSCGKEVNLETHGKDTELDKTIIEAIKDPLTHVIRNAVDHGIELPHDRIAVGKSASGVLSMRAFHEGGQVIIEIADDGAGLKGARIKAKAIEKGLITVERSEQMSESEIYRLIFLPGFSTAEQVTSLSGRGVGMDVVRSNIERIGGTVDVSSKEGLGTTFTIKIPLTLAIIPALIISGGGCRYAIPQVNLLELIRVEISSDGKGKNFERVEGADFYRLRGELLPLVYLSNELQLKSAQGRERSTSGALNVVVVRADHHQFGLVVDEIQDTEEIVVKPLGRLLKSINTFAGATIMGDGEIALILDVVGIARNAHVTRRERTVREPRETVVTEKDGEFHRLLVFRLGGDQRAAVPLDQVYRLEEFDTHLVEKCGSHGVIQYRGAILPLVDISLILRQRKSVSGDLMKAFVYSDGNRFVGFVVDEIVDIVEQIVKVEQPFRQCGVYGSAVIQERVTDLIDLQDLIALTELAPAQTRKEQSVTL